MSVFSRIYHSLSSTIKTPANFFSTSAPSSSLSQPRIMDVEKFVNDKVKSHKIVVFSKTYCPYCTATKNYFASNYPNEEVEVVELNNRNDESAIQDYLLQKTGGRSVPRTFINGTSIGGNSDLQGMPKGKVTALITGA
ncbi:thioredoxin-like protein [Melanogaster broomeanus]|nr:thioredoxin-like protein [Melanogaster broomeanus]